MERLLSRNASAETSQPWKATKADINDTVHHATFVLVIIVYVGYACLFIKSIWIWVQARSQIANIDSDRYYTDDLVGEFE